MKIIPKQLTTLLLIFLVSISKGVEQESSYGVDVSFPMHTLELSNNYPWLPHNLDPENNPIPPEYKDMPIQPLGNKREFYNNFMQGCRNYYGKQGSTCDDVEVDRVEMGLLQPQRYDDR